jgi:hypothetical protein
MSSFLIDHRLQTNDTRLVVAARCITDVSVGDRFVLAIPSGGYIDVVGVHEYFWPPQSVDLIVTEIEAYGHAFDTISRGMTAKITLEGSDKLQPTPCVMLTKGEPLPVNG